MGQSTSLMVSAVASETVTLFTLCKGLLFVCISCSLGQSAIWELLAQL